MNYIVQTQKIVKEILKIADIEGKLTGFSIGNTAKIDDNSLYFTPIRDTSVVIIGGVIVYSEKQAIEIAKAIDGKVHYILVDSEKKIPDEMSLTGEPSNVERSVRESVKKSTLWVYKGNDLSVEAVDTLLAQLTRKSIKGIGGRKITILGAGNLGAKLALKLVERGANITITRRNKEILEAITQVLNYIKPKYTTSKVVCTTDNDVAAKGAEILIGTTQGIPVITKEMIKRLRKRAIIVDVGKGTLYPEAIKAAEENKFNIYRLDISAVFEGLIHQLQATERLVEQRLGRRVLYEEYLVSGGLIGRENEIIVDNVWEPTRVYGVANGRGDFIRSLSSQQKNRIERLEKLFSKK
jgi:hypothetical protein|tara:strand:- start:8546 stop:9604 length:1059 start_codon:yes stop_codon:yes gene_type:complete